MSFVKIPIRNDIFAYTMRVELDFVIYTLGFRYNRREDRWVMDISDEQNTPLLFGIILQTGIPLKLGMIGEGLPPRDFYCVHTSGENIDPDLNNFGTDITLLYGD